jgi:hypothetical protein
LIIFWCLIFEVPPIWRANSLYSYPPGTGCPTYTPRKYVRFSSPPTTYRAVVDVFETASTRAILNGKVMLRPTVSGPVCLGIKHPFGAYDQIFLTCVTVTVCSCGAPSLTRGRVCLFYVLLALASAVFLGSESLGT